MKYTLSINQYCWEKHFKGSLDAIDLLLYDYVKTFMLSDKCQFIIYEHKPYYWIDPMFAISELPILGITTTRGMNKRLENLINAGLLERCPNNQSQKKTYLTTGAMFSQYEGYRNENSSLGTVVPTPTWNDCSNNHNININQEKKNDKKTELPYQSKAFDDAWCRLLNLPKWKKKTQSQLEFSLKKLARVSEEDAIRAINATFENGWQGIFVKEEKKEEKKERAAWEQYGITEEEYWKLKG